MHDLLHWLPITDRVACLLDLKNKIKASAAQATFKSIRSLVPLFDRVLVQRFKPETVGFSFFLPQFR
jgi:hypothetical protein